MGFPSFHRMDLGPVIELLKAKLEAYRNEIKDLDTVISSCTTKEEARVQAIFKNSDASRESYEDYYENMHRASRKNKKSLQKDAAMSKKRTLSNYVKDVSGTIYNLTKAQKTIDTHLQD